MVFDWLLKWGEVISGFGSVLLAAVLAILYKQQKDLLSDQHRAQHEAVIEIEEFGPEWENIEMSLSNVGNGVGLDPELVVLGIYTDESGEVSDGIITKPIKRADRRSPVTGGSIKSRESRISYEIEPALPSLFDGSRTGFSSAIQELLDEEIAIARLHYFIRYTDLTGRYHIEYAEGWEFVPEEEIEYAHAALNNGNIMVYGEPEVDADKLAYDISSTPSKPQPTIV